MSAIISIGGHQFRVTLGSHITTVLHRVKVGDMLEIPAIMAWDDKNNVTLDKQQRSMVKVKVIEVKAGEKLDVYRFKHKSRYRRHSGFRSRLTRLQVTDILLKSPMANKLTRPTTKSSA